MTCQQLESDKNHENSIGSSSELCQCVIDAFCHGMLLNMLLGPALYTQSQQRLRWTQWLNVICTFSMINPGIRGTNEKCQMNYPRHVCKEARVVWTFNKWNRVCEKLTDRTCGLNQNAFDTKEECIENCYA